MSVQSTTSSPEPQLLTHASSDVESKALTSAGSSDYKDIVVERNSQTNSTGQLASSALSRNATLATAEGFSLGVTDAAVAAGINEALSKLIEVDVLRRKLNRDLTFMEADNIAKKMKTAAEKERQGAALALGMAVAGGVLSVGMGSTMIGRGNRHAKATDAVKQKSAAVDDMHASIVKPLRDSSDVSGGVKMQNGQWDNDLQYASWQKSGGKNADKPGAHKVDAETAVQERVLELRAWARGQAVKKDADGKWLLDNNTKQPQYEKLSSDPDTRLTQLNGNKALADMKDEELIPTMKRLEGKVDQEIRLRSLMSGDGQHNILTGKETENKVNKHAAHKELSQFEEKMAATGYQDDDIVKKLGDIARQDQILTSQISMVQVPGNIISSTGGSVADLTFNKEAKELEAEAARDGATQSFFSDNAGTVGSEIQGAMSGIESVKAFIEVGSAIAAGMRA